MGAEQLNGIRYYRLKILDRDGSYTYSKLVIPNSKIDGGFSVFSNTAVNTITVTYPGAAGLVKMQLIGADGKLLQTNTLPAGTMQTTMDVKALATGSYYIKPEDGQNIVPFIKQ